MHTYTHKGQTTKGTTDFQQASDDCCGLAWEELQTVGCTGKITETCTSNPFLQMYIKSKYSKTMNNDLLHTIGHQFM